MANLSRTTTRFNDQDLALIKHQLQTLEQSLATGVLSVELRDNELMLALSDGRSLVLSLPGPSESMDDLLAQLPPDLAQQIQALMNGTAVTTAQLGGLPATPAAPAEANTEIIARVAEAAGEVKVQRAGQEIALKPGDGLLAGDTVLTAAGAQLRIELLSQQNTVTGTGVVGESSKVTLGAQSAGAGPVAVYKVDAGAMVFDRLVDSGVRLQVITPAGAVQTGGQGIGVNVNSQTGETTVIGLPGAGAGAGAASSVQIITPNGGLNPITVPAQGLVFNPSSGSSSGSAGSGLAPAVNAAANNQMAPIAKLITAPSFTDTGAQGTLSLTNAPSNALATSTGLAAQTPSNLNAGVDSSKGMGLISGGNFAPFTLGSQITDLRPLPRVELPIESIKRSSVVQAEPIAQTESPIVMPAVPMVMIAASAASVEERAGKVTFTIKLSEKTTQPVTVKWALDGANTAGAASVLRVPSRSGDLQFSPGEDTKVIEVAINPDFERQTSGFFSVTLQSSVGGILGSPSSQVVTVTDVAAMTGTSQADSMVGGGAADTLDGREGNDTLDGGSGADVLLGGNGDDVLFFDANDETIDGGAGNDRLIIRDTTADLSLLPSGRLVNIETIDMTGNGNNTITLSDATMVDLVGGATPSVLNIWGNAGDKLVLTDLNWVAGPDDTGVDTLGNAVTYKTYTLNGRTLRVDADVQVSFEARSTQGNDLINGGGNADYIAAQAGDDTLSGGLGADTLLGGAGNDVMIFDANDALIDGGAGNDRLVVTDPSVDFTTLPAGKVVNVETIDLSGNGGQSIKLSAANVNDMVGNNTPSVLNVWGDANDKLVLTDSGWVKGAVVTDGGVTYQTYTLNGKTLRVDVNVQVTTLLVGTSGNDTLDGGPSPQVVLAGDGDDTLIYDPNDATMDGGAGTDTLVVRTTQLDLTSPLNRPVLAGLEKIQLDPAFPTQLALNYDSVLSLSDTSNTLYITGNDSDSVALLDTWTAGADNGIYKTFTSGVSPNVVTLYIESTINLLKGVSGTTSNDDVINGTAAPEFLDGGAGNDVLNGGGGNDVLRGGTGDDTLDGGGQTDTADYSQETSGITVNLADGTATDGSGGSDTLSNIENITGGAGGDSLTGGGDFNQLDGGAGNDLLNGGGGDDTLLGGSGSDTLLGGDGNDTLSGGSGDDTLNGGAGRDTADYSASNEAVAVDLFSGAASDGMGGTDDLVSIENVKGGSGSDTLTGDAQANRLEGGAGADTLQGGAGDDTLDGGSGTDLLSYAANTSNQPINVNLATGTATDGLGGTDTLLNLENVQGGAGNDTITGSSGGNQLIGGLGRDSLLGGAGSDTLDGGEGSDLLDGGSDNDLLQGGVGNDTLRGGQGSDTLEGGDGIDLADFSNESSAMAISLADGTMKFGSTITDTMTGIENVAGGTDNDTMAGDTGNNEIWGNGGNDSISADAGNDSVRGGSGNDALDGGAGIDTVLYDDVTGPVVINLGSTSIIVNSTVVAAGTSQGFGSSNAGIDTLQNFENVVGTGGADTIVGSAGDNVIEGGSGADSIDAGAGNDIIYFDEADARVDGGAGTDTLKISASTSTVDLTLTRDDVLTNFEVIDLTATGGQLLKLSDADVRALTTAAVDTSVNPNTTTYSLIVKGTVEDSVRMVGASWPTEPNQPNETIDGVVFNVYAITQGNTITTLKIQQGVPIGYLFQGTEGPETLTGGAGGDQFEGNGGNDTIIAGGGNDKADGGAGDDNIDGGTGNDTLLGGDGHDTLLGGVGDDSLDGGTGDDSLNGGEGNDTILGGAGNDNIISAEGNDSVNAGDGNDTVDAGAGNDTVDGGAGDDSIQAGAGNDSVNAGIGNDTVNGGAGDDTLDGGAGVDLLDYSDNTGAVTVNLVTSLVTSTQSGNDTISNFENVTTGAGNDSITGSDAANRIIGGGGVDTINAGAGDDWVLFDKNDATVDGGAGNDVLAIQTTETIDFTNNTLFPDNKYVGFEAIDLTNPAGVAGNQSIKLGLSDVMAFSNTSDELKIHGDAGDTVTLAGNWTVVGTQPVIYSNGTTQQYVKLQMSDPTTGNPVTVLVDPEVAVKLIITGTETSNTTTNGIDTLTGSAGNDTIQGLSGNDSIDGGAGADNIDAGSGNDTIIYDAADTVVNGGEDTDTLKLSTTASGLILDLTTSTQSITNMEVIDLTGKTTSPVGNNTLIIDPASLAGMTPGSNTLTINGDTGDSVFRVGTWTSESTNVPSGYTRYKTTVNTVDYFLNIKNGITNGHLIEDTTPDNAADPVLNGTSGVDLIRGLDGPDEINGGAEKDLIYAGDGNDTILFDAADALVDGGAGTDTLKSSGTAMDLTVVDDAVLRSMEVIDLVTGAPNTVLTMNATDVAALNSDKTVTVLGDGSDTVALQGNWTQGADDGFYKVYTLDGSTVRVKNDVPVTITYTGTSLSDEMISGAGHQSISGGSGADYIDGGAGNDTLNGGAGDDTLVYDSADASIIGGTGTDTLKITGSGVTLDLTDSPVPNKISGIEKIDLTGAGNNTLVITADYLKALSDETNTLIVTGDAGDAFRLAGMGWESRGSELVAGITYNKYVGVASDGTSVTLLAGLSLVKGDEILGTNAVDDPLVGTAGGDMVRGLGGNDTLNGMGGADLLYGGDGDDVLIYGSEDVVVDGGAGADTLKVEANGEIIDLQLLGRQDGGTLRPTLLNLETIDLNTTGANYLILDGAAVRSLTGVAVSTVAELTLKGNSDDIVFIDDTWTTDTTGANPVITLSNGSKITLMGGLTVKALVKGDANANNIADTLTIEAIKSGAGKDTIVGGSGVDIIYAGAGDDTVDYDAADIRVFGEAGTDTLVVRTVDSDNGGATTNDGDVDFTSSAGTIYTGFEVISMRGNGNQTIKLDAPSVLAMSDTGKITVKGDLGDVLKLYGAWTSEGVESDADGKIYNLLRKGDALVSVEQTITLQITNELGSTIQMGTENNDDMNIASGGGALAGDGDDIIRIYNTSYTGVDGGRGYDKVYYELNSGSTSAIRYIDTRLIPQTGLTNVEEIDLRRDHTGLTSSVDSPLSYVPNRIAITPDKLLEMTDEDAVLIIRGDTTRGYLTDPLGGTVQEQYNGTLSYITRDSIDLVGNWGDLINNISTVEYNGETFTQIIAPNGARLLYTPGMTTTPVNPTPQLSAFSVAYDDGAYLVGSGIDQYAGWKVENAGDVNKDGIDDMIINARDKAYVVFGNESMMGQFDLSNLGDRGFSITGVATGDFSTDTWWGYGVDYSELSGWGAGNRFTFQHGLSAIGDINGDGIADMAATTGTRDVKIIYGRTNWSSFDLGAMGTSASTGYNISLVDFYYQSYQLKGIVIKGVGDVNGDGYADFVVSHSEALNGSDYKGLAYLFFGGTHPGGNISTNSMTVNRGITLRSDAVNSTNIGIDVTGLGDINGDGFGDILVGGANFSGTGVNGQTDHSGSGYIVFGKADGWGNTVVVQRDITSPTLTTLSPADNANPVALTSNLRADFSESIKAGSGLVMLYKASNGQLVESFNVATGTGNMGGKLVIVDNVLYVNPFDKLQTSASYYVQIQQGAILDLAGNAYSGIAETDTSSWNFTATSVASGDSAKPTLNSTFTLQMSNYTTNGGYDGYQLTSTYNTDSTATNVKPRPSYYTGAYKYEFQFGFSEAIKPYGTVQLLEGTTVVESFNLQTGVGSRGGTISINGTGADGSTVYLNSALTLKGGALHTFKFIGVQDAVGNEVTGGEVSFDFTTATDARAPMLQQTNAPDLAMRGNIVDGTTGVLVESNLVFKASEALKLGSTGLIKIVNYSDESAFITFDVNDKVLGSNGAYTITGTGGSILTLNGRNLTIDPGPVFAYGATYSLKIDAGALTDLNDMDVVSSSTQSSSDSLGTTYAYTDKNTLNFSTTSGLYTVSGGNAVDKSLKVGINDNIEITFSETVQAGTATGNSKFIKLFDSSGRLIQSFDVTSITGDISFSGNKVILNPAASLKLASGYYLTVDSGAVGATYHAGTVYSGTSNNTTLTFSTEAAVQIDPGQSKNIEYFQVQNSPANTSTAEWAGQAVEAVGDFDGDGINDFVVGSYQKVSDSAILGGYAYGKFYLIFGKAGEWSPITTIDQLKAQGRVVELYGTATNWITRIVEFGDLNKDGYADLLLSSGGKTPNSDSNNTNDATVSNDGDLDAGSVFVVFGQDRSQWAPKTSVTNLGEQGIEITGGLPQEQLGYSISSGDFNNDGWVDIFMGMPVNHRDGFASGEGFVINGGDLTQSLMEVGTSGNDVLVGDYNADRLSGGGGNDTLHGLGGADILRGGEGDDTITISDLNFVLVDGGTNTLVGVDTLKFQGRNINLDLTGFAGASIRSFEKIDITGDGANSLIFNYREVIYLLERQLSQAYGQNYTFTVDGNNDDRLTIEGPWAVVVTGAEYVTYALDGIYLKVDKDITTNVAGWTIPYPSATIDLMGTNYPTYNSTSKEGLRVSSLTGISTGSDAIGGSYMVNIGDVNRDGYTDFAYRDYQVTGTSLPYVWRGWRYDANYNWVYDSSANTTTGYFYNGNVNVVYGKAGGIGDVNLTNLTAGGATGGMRLTGSASISDQFGQGLANLGDINGDGKDDLMIIAPYSSDTFTFTEGKSTTGSSATWQSDSWTASNNGRVYLFLGGNSSLDDVGTNVNVTTNTLNNDYPGLDAARTSGFPTTYTTSPIATTDLPNESSNETSSTTNATTVYSYTGVYDVADVTLNGSAGQSLGSTWQPVGVGDVDGDGYGDFITGASNGYLIFGKANWSDASSLSADPTTWSGVRAVSIGSWSDGVQAAADMNGDGYADFMLGNAGYRYLVLGSKSADWVYSGSTQISFYNGNITSVLNGTSRPLATQINPEAGFSLNNTTGEVLYAANMKSLGDLNGDGYSDFLFGSYYLNDYNAKDNGGAYVLFGKGTGWGSTINLGTLAADGAGFRITGSVDVAYAGYNMTAAGDVNGDGLDDFVVTEYGDAEGNNGTAGAGGSAYLILGRQSGWKDINLLEVQEYGIQLLDGGWSTYGWQSLGDLDGDGFDDLGYSTNSGAKIFYGTSYLSYGTNVGVQHAAYTINNNGTPADASDDYIQGYTLNANLGASMTPNPLLSMDRLIGNGGNDTLNGDGGRDVLIGGAGKDTLKIADGNFFKLDGGTGVDTVLIQQTTAANPLTIDFTTIMNSRIENIEVLKLGDGTQSVKLNALDVLNMTGEANTAVVDTNYQKGNVLVIDTGAGSGSDTADTVELAGVGWSDTGVDTAVTGLTGTFSVYQNSTKNIYVLVDATATLS